MSQLGRRLGCDSSSSISIDWFFFVINNHNGDDGDNDGDNDDDGDDNGDDNGDDDNGDDDE